MVKVSFNMCFDRELVHLVPNFDINKVFHFYQYLHEFTDEIYVPTDFDYSDTLQYIIITLPDSIIDTPMASSSGRVDIIPKNGTFNRIILVFDMISTLPLELAIGVSMMLSDIVIIVYCKVSEWSKSVGTCILIVNSCT